MATQRSKGNAASLDLVGELADGELRALEAQREDTKRTRAIVVAG